MKNNPKTSHVWLLQLGRKTLAAYASRHPITRATAFKKVDSFYFTRYGTSTLNLVAIS